MSPGLTLQYQMFMLFDSSLQQVLYLHNIAKSQDANGHSYSLGFPRPQLGRISGKQDIISRLFINNKKSTNFIVS